MGMYGPIPKRDSERIRQNKPLVPTEIVQISGEVPVPDLDIPNAHPMITDFYESLRDSAQSKYYEPSDWSYMRFILHFCDGLVKSSRPSGRMLATISSAMSDLLVSEGSRRRVRMEMEREAAANHVIDISK